MKTLTQLFLRGLLVLIPFLVTGALVYWLFMTGEELFRIPLEFILPEGWYFRGLGLICAVVFTLLVGLLVNIYIVELVVKAFEKLLNKLPLVKQIYNSIRDFVSFIGGSDKEDLQKVVAISINGIKLIGFVTGEDKKLFPGNDSEKWVSVYLPMSYQVGGYLVYVQESQCEALDISVDQAMQTILTANIAGEKE